MLVIADPTKDSLDADHDWHGAPAKAFGAKTFWRVLRAESGQACDIVESSETKRVARRVWNLGSTRYLDS